MGAVILVTLIILISLYICIKQWLCKHKYERIFWGTRICTKCGKEKEGK